MDYQKLKELFCKHESSCPKTHLTAYITFASFGPENKKNYPWESRTYVISSDNKAFQPNMGGYSIFGSCLDGTDRCIRLENYMADEHGGEDGWIVEDCCIIGYLLVEASETSISTPKMFYSIDAARDEMLSRVAAEIKIDPETLKVDYAKAECRIDSDDFMVEKFNAWAGLSDEDELWEIKLAYIYDVLRIEFDHEHRAE